MKITKMHIYEVQSYIIILILLLNCGTTFSIVYQKLITGLIIIVTLILILFFKIKSKNIIISFFLTGFLFLVGLRNLQNSREIVFIVNILIACIYVNYIKIKDFFYKMSKIIYMFSIISFIAYIVGLMNPKLIKIIPQYEFHTLYYLVNFYKSDLFSGLIRTSGIFWEPGLYQMFLNIALINYLFKNKKFKVIFLITQIILTGSITGYMVILIIIAYRLIDVLKKQKLIIFLIIFFATLILRESIFEIYQRKKMTQSYIIRINDLKIPIELSLKNPILGYGINNNKEFSNYFNSDKKVKKILGNVENERGISNGLIQVLYYKGYFIFMFYLISLIKFCKIYSKEWHIYFCTLIIGLMNEPVSFRLLFLYIFVYGIINIKKRGREK